MDCGEVKGQGGQSCAVKGDRNKMGKFYDVKVCLFTSGSNWVLRMRLIMQGQTGMEKVLEKAWGVNQGNLQGLALEKEQGYIFMW